ncbi:MAG: thiamine phosphate synthase [Rhodospirillales bacterium]|nr:thiamine phosphate synthase [Rhodospirillales bacterium]
MTACRLYIITPPALTATEAALSAFGDDLARALDAGDAASVQLRLKDADMDGGDDAVRRACDALRPIVQDRDVAFLLNDRPDLAAETGCDGVHIGQEDAGYDAARKLVGSNAIVGVTCHNSRHLAMTAAEKGADYVAFGAFFPTQTKQPRAQAELETLEIWSATMTTPCVAIGGITAANCAPLVRAGADFLAVVGAVWNHPDGPAAGVKAMNAAIRTAEEG